MSTVRLMRELRDRIDGPRWRTPIPKEETLPLRLRTEGLTKVPIKKIPPVFTVPKHQQKLSLPSSMSFSNPNLLKQLQLSTPAKIGVGRSGFRYTTKTLLDFQTRFAVAKAAVDSRVPNGWASELGWIELQTSAENQEQFLARPDLGRQLPEQALQIIRQKCRKNPDVQIVVGDGLSANAVMLNAPAMVSGLIEQLQQRGISVGDPVFVHFCRSRLVDIIGNEVGAKVGIILVGERPGLGTGDGMSAYLVWQPSEQRTDAEKQAISNIHSRGIQPNEASIHAAKVIEAILKQQTSGVKLDLSNL